jgi:hypothetical protein
MGVLPASIIASSQTRSSQVKKDTHRRLVSDDNRYSLIRV